MRPRVHMIIALSIGSLLGSRPASDARIASVVIDPKSTPITMHWADDSGRVFGSIGRLKAHFERRGKRLRFAMNAGMYMEDQRPLGLYMENGRSIRKLVTKTSGYGNFYLQPNGVFSVADGIAAVFPTSQTVLEAKGFATQSGPMLVVNGRVNPAFTRGSTNLNIRNGVGILPDNKVLFAISRQPVNFFDFAVFFEQHGCNDALFLDGAISRAYMPDLGIEQLDGKLGPLIAVAE